MPGWTEGLADATDPDGMWECWWTRDDGMKGTVWRSHLRPTPVVKAWMREEAERGWAKRDAVGK